MSRSKTCCDGRLCSCSRGIEKVNLQYFVSPPLLSEELLQAVGNGIPNHGKVRLLLLISLFRFFVETEESSRLGFEAT